MRGSVGWFTTNNTQFISFLYMILVVTTIHMSRAHPTSHTPSLYYNYFAIGSNMYPPTMESLRNIRAATKRGQATAAILPHYRLSFSNTFANTRGNEGGACPSRQRPFFLGEPSAAYATKVPGALLHGVLYPLSAQEFATVGFTEGVPWAYQWETCWVYPYQGDNQKAGEVTLQQQQRDMIKPIKAYVLVHPHAKANDTMSASATLPHIPPSTSYMDILQKGANHWKMDRSYRIYLGQITCATNLIPPQGLSGLLLEWSMLVNPPASKDSGL